VQRRLHPQFLFSTLNSIKAMMRTDVEEADTLIARLSDLLRITLRRGTVQEVPLAEEIDALRTYLDIEQTRLRNRLTVHIDIAPDALEAIVPSLLLQPLVDNAIRNTAGLDAMPATIEIRAWRDQAALRIEVRDDAPGPTEPGHLVDEGPGLATTRVRLERLYGADHRFFVTRSQKQGTTVAIVVPFRIGSGAFDTVGGSGGEAAHAGGR
jgi:two-component system, LytTR family, sensor kinase